MTKCEIAEAFSKHNFQITFPFLVETIEWKIVGGASYKGKQQVVDACNPSADYHKTATTEFSKFIIMESDLYVVVDSTAKYVDANANVSNVASCDIYMFNDGKLIEITSYCVELK